MTWLSGIANAVKTLFANLFQQPDWRNFLDIFITAVIIYALIRLIIRTRSSAVIKGVAVLLLFAWLTNVLQLNVVSWMLQQVLNTGVVVLVILFQPELRKALEQLGRSSFISSGSGSHSSSANTSQIVSEIVTAMTDMSKKRIGALIVVERKTGLREFADTGTMINADITAPLIENIFEPNTPLHDGAMIIRDGRILAAACILQLSNDPDISKELGTRHRAAIGITETSDAVALVVSEETGVISAAREGRLNRYIDQKTLTGILTELFEGKLGRSVRLLKPSGGEAGK
ncbi:MAG: diadenylate cyclase CdaA [Clostridia bacterium]|nr:diadenylate cyclase CdaA [Clostridia bacterium]MBR6498149.1 diadenylate cyclase CdaA [Clostridia bacterium]